MENNINSLFIHNELMDYIDDYIIAINLEGIITYVNQSVTRLFNVEKKQILNKNIDLFGENLSKDTDFKKLVVEIIAGGRWHGELVHFLDNGNKVVLDARTWIITDNNSESIGIVGYFSDISERKKTEDELKVADHERKKLFNELEQIINTTSIGLCLIDTNFIITKVNTTFIDMFSSIKTIPGETRCSDIFKDAPYYQTKNCPFKRILNGEEHYEFELEKEVDDNVKKIFNVSIKPFYSPLKKITGILCSLTNITKLRTLERLAMNAIEIERQNIGQILHDGVSQKLAGITYHLEALKLTLDQKNIDESKDIDEINSVVKDSMDNLRKIAKDMFIMHVKDFNLENGLRELAGDVMKIHNIDIQVKIEDKVDIKDTKITTNLYDIAREAVGNAIRHSDSKQIIITINQKKDIFTMTIHNSGKSKEKDKNKPSGIGMIIMQYRASLIGAQFQREKMDDGYKISIILNKTL